MSEPTPLFVGLDVHKDSIAVAHAQGQSADPPVYVGAIGTRVKEQAAPCCVRWTRCFLTRPASNEPALADQGAPVLQELERNGGCQDWQVRQAEQALRIYFVNFLQ